MEILVSSVWRLILERRGFIAAIESKRPAKNKAQLCWRPLQNLPALRSAEDCSVRFAGISCGAMLRALFDPGVLRRSLLECKLWPASFWQAKA
jgi:hypothetical protein